MQPTISITILFLAILSLKSNIYIVQCTSSYESNSPTLSPSDAPTSAASAADAPTSAASAADAPTSAAAADAPTSAASDAPSSAAAADAPTSTTADAPSSAAAADAPTSTASDAPTSAATDGPTSAVADGPTLVASDGPTLAPSDAPSHNNVKDPDYITSPSSAPIAMQDADGDPINLPFSFNPFDPKQQQEAPLPKAVEPDVKKTCDATDDPDLCVSSLTPFLTNNKEAKTDTLSLLEMQIKATLQATQHAIELSSSENVGLSDSLRDCKELYDDAKDNLKHALEALSSKDIGTINSMLSAVVSDFSTCNDGFQESGNSSPMADYGNKLSQLVSNCLATVSLIKNN